tara:strand:+ start:481 stop:639 length:159 start_codon:yes stop_codon:yes gene_type:complete
MANFAHSKAKAPGLDKAELEFLLQFLAMSAFKGENVKILYSIVNKLQAQIDG